jgi:hypothetical protein
MQLKSFLIGCLSLAVATGASAQVEYDDMYFNSADRRELNALKGTPTLALTGKKKKALTEEFNNPTDSYSARNINPEHVSRSNANEARTDDLDYFITNYTRKSAAGYSAWHNQFNSWYNSPWYTTGWYGASRWYPFTPYYSHMYTPYWSSTLYDPFWYDPWYYDTFYMGLGGPAWRFGYGFNYGFPAYWGISHGFGWYNSWYPRVIIVDNDAIPNVQYRKRPTRGVASYNNSTVTNSRSRSSVSTPPSYNRPNTGGRTSSGITTSNSSQQSSYYNKNWRSASQSAPGRSSWSSDSNTRSSYDRGSYDRGSRAPSYSPSPQRSYGGSSYGGGSSGSSGGGSNGRSRGSR